MTIREILRTERVLEDLKTRIPDKKVGEAVVDCLKATWNVYLVCMKQKVDDDHPQIFQDYKEKFMAVKKILKGVSHTPKTHMVTGTYNFFLFSRVSDLTTTYVCLSVSHQFVKPS